MARDKIFLTDTGGELMTTDRLKNPRTLDPSGVVLAEIIDIPIAEFLNMNPAPGHRDSRQRAERSTHLHILVDEHLDVEVAEYPDGTGRILRESMTGNTRREVWKRSLSDKVPQFVRARLFKLSGEVEARERMLRHDAPEASWSSNDYVHRALNMTYGDDWKPSSKALKGGRFVMAVRVADCLISKSHWSPDTSIKIELVLPRWAKQLQMLDEIVEAPVADAIHPKKPFSWGFLGGLLMLLRFRDPEAVGAFARQVLNDGGTKTEEGADGVFSLVENLGGKSKGGAVDTQRMILMSVLGAFEMHEQGNRISNGPTRVKKFDPIPWIKKEHDAAKNGAQKNSERA